MTFDPHLLRSHVWLYPRITVSKSHGNTSMYLDTVINFANYHIHILRTESVITYFLNYVQGRQKWAVWLLKICNLDKFVQNRLTPSWEHHPSTRQNRQYLSAVLKLVNILSLLKTQHKTPVLEILYCVLADDTIERGHFFKFPEKTRYMQWRAIGVARGGAECHPWQRKFAKNQGKRGKIGKRQKSREVSFTLPLLTDRAGYATDYMSLGCSKRSCPPS